MNKKELFRLMDGDLIDQVPVSFWHHFFDKDTRERYENEPLLDEFFEFNRKWKEETQPDYVKIMTDFYRKPAIDIGSGTPEDIAALKIPQLQGAPQPQQQGFGRRCTAKPLCRDKSTAEEYCYLIPKRRLPFSVVMSMTS